MRSFAIAAASVAALASGVLGQTDHRVVVGGASGLVFTPNQVTAAVGDTVTFEFQSKNHTVTQSAFATPCTLLTNTTSNQVGFDSGFVPVAANATEFPAWTLQVTASTPLWAFCRQTGHCEQGMVMSINAPTTGAKTFSAFQASAIALASNSSTTTSTTGTTTTSSGTSTSASSTSSSTSGASSLFASSGLALAAAAVAALLA